MFNKLLLTLFILSLSSFSRNIDSISKISLEKNTAFFNSLSIEKLYVHFDRSEYNAKDDIWFKVYLLEANSHGPGLSKVVYLDLINSKNKIIDSKTVKINSGFGHGDFKLPFDISYGKYTIRAYTNFMRNFNDSYFFRKNIYINSPYSAKNIPQVRRNGKLQNESKLKKKKVDLQFFPEGGYMVNDFVNRISFKALETDGKGLNLSGEIINDSNLKIIKFNTSKFGMGVFQLTPKKGVKYRAKIMYNNIEFFYELPTPLNIGIVMQTLEYKDHFRVNIQSSINLGAGRLRLVGKQRNGVVFNSQFASDKSKIIAKIPKNILEQGIVQFTLFDANEKPVSERLVFFENELKGSMVDISTSKTVYEKNEPIALDISIAKTNNLKTIANTSVAVTSISKNKLENYYSDIKTYLLLNSEIRGNIEQPSYYFNSNDPQRKNNLDILMMTQGWRQYMDIGILNSDKLNFKFAHEMGISLKGSVKSSDKQYKPVVSSVSLTYKNDGAIGFDEVETDSLGSFVFKDLDFIDTTSVIIQAKKIATNKNTNSNFLIEMESINTPAIRELHDFGNIMADDDLYEKRLALPMNKKVVQLEVIQLKSNKKIEKNRYRKKRTIYQHPSQTLDFKEIQSPGGRTSNPLNSLTGRVPGFNIRDDGVYFRGANSFNFENNKALILLDGTPVEDVFIIEAIPFSEIDFIDVLKGPRAAIYGSRASGGVVAIYTKDSSNKTTRDKKTKGVLNFSHPGFNHARKFYEPAEINKIKSHRSDLQTSLLYWNPTVILNKGSTYVNLPSTRESGIYQVILEGMTFDGNPIVSKIIFNVR